MWLGPGLNKPPGCWGCPYLDECIAAISCNATAGSAVGVVILRGPDDVGASGSHCKGQTIAWALNGTALVNEATGLCAEVGPGRGSVVLAVCDAGHPMQRWTQDVASMQLRLVGVQPSLADFRALPALS
jgi:hypothetical protein